ncbi:MAG TPA: serpin family protein [Longimicrobiales bacterium]|nr:serpin family protein [Longimicrobiales bacterium]
MSNHPAARLRTASLAALAALSLAGCAALGLGGCSDAAGPDEGGEPITELPRALSVSERAVIEGSNAFGVELFARVVAEDARPNIVLSPLSASMALGMTLNGADGPTFDAMRSTLGFGGLTQEEINASYRDLIDLLRGLDPAVQFAIANAIWANEQYAFHQSFFDAVSAAFDASAESRDFGDPATLADINAWVDESTEGLIDSILDSLDPELVMLLVNAIYFDGAWTNEFDPDDTRTQAFTRADGSTVQVDMMTMSGVEFPLGGGQGYSAVEMPYGGGAFSMVVVVPSGSGARDFAATLDADAWDALVEGLVPQELDALSIPKLTLEYDTYLNDALDAMGMGVAFRPGADFTRLSPAGNQMCIDFVRQKTFIEVDERGTRAAAVTAVGIGPTSFIGLIADRPFVFALRERLSGTILFVGLVEDPTATTEDAEPYESECV